MEDEPLTPATASSLVKRGRPKADLPELPAALCKLCDEPSSRLNGMCARHAGAILSRDEEKRLTREFLERHAHRAAQLQVEGAEIAARKGDTRPAEWLLLHTRIVEPVRTNVDAGGGVVVNIGMVLPGCGQ